MSASGLSKEQWTLIASAVQSMRGRAGLKPDIYQAIDSLAARLASACPLCGGEHRVDKCDELTAKTVEGAAVTDLTAVDTRELLAELDRRVRAAAPPKVWFFGVWPGERYGHFVRDKNGTMIRWPDENTLYPWRYWDYAAPQDEGRMWHRYVDGRTVLVSWDRSADRRGGCAASFIVDSLVPPEHALTIARSTFPRVFDRIETHLGRAVVLAGPAE